MDSISKRDNTVASKILREIKDIKEFISGMTEAGFYDCIKTQKAVVMSLINIGELSKSFTSSFTNANNKIPWNKVQAMRNVAAHKYEAIDMQIVWDTIQVSVVELENELNRINSSEPPNDVIPSDEVT